MKQLLWILAVLSLTASVASAGPNAGGVLWVHDTGVMWTDDPMTFPPPPADCPGGVDNQQPLWDGVTPADAPNRFWKVYAAFPPGSSPRLKTLGWGIQFPEARTSASSYVVVTGGDRPDGETSSTIFFIGLDGFPTSSGGTIGQSFPPGPRLTAVTALFSFWGFAYNNDGTAPPTWSTVVNVGNDFGDDAVPANTDPIMGFGSLGFGVAGTTPCPTSDPDAACCTFTSNSPPDSLVVCRIRKQADCVAPSVWHGEWYTCDPMPCPPPTGACCLPDGRCIETPCITPNPPCPTITQVSCTQVGGTYQGNGTTCPPNPACPPGGACCFPSGTCQVKTQSFCEALDPPGTWHSEWTTCTPNPCSLPIGSCCLPSGRCTVETATTCTAGDWTLSGTCTPNICPAPPDAEAACCDLLQRECTLRTQANCAPPSQWHVEWPACEPSDPCLTLQGACCAQDGLCTFTTRSDCDPSSTWRGNLLSCTPNLCPPLPTESTSWGQIKNRYH